MPVPLPAELTNKVKLGMAAAAWLAFNSRVPPALRTTAMPALLVSRCACDELPTMLMIDAPGSTVRPLKPWVTAAATVEGWKMNWPPAMTSRPRDEILLPVLYRP